MRRQPFAFALFAALVVAALAVPALATVPPDPNHHVIQNLGRNVVQYTHFGDPDLGLLVGSAQGQTVDTNGNGIADALRGRGALDEDHGVVRLRIMRIKLQVFYAETWRNVAIDEVDKVSTVQPSYVVNYTPTASFCSSTLLTYRVVHDDAIRWLDNTVGYRTTISQQFQARGAVNTQACG